MDKEKGFSLVEVMAVVAILALVSLFLTQIYIDYVRLYGLENAKVDLNLASQAALSDLSSHIKAAVAVLATSTFSGIEFTSDDQTLILSLPAFDIQGQILSGVYDQALYFRPTSTPRQLIKKVAPAPTSRRAAQNKTLMKDVSFLDFAYNAAPVSDAKDIVTTLAASRLVYGQNLAVTGTLRAVLRNK